MNIAPARRAPPWCAFAVMALATAAQAADEPVHGERSKAHVMDEDQDGKVSMTEHAAGAKKMFAKLDTDYDGRLTLTELGASHGGEHGKRSDEAMSPGSKIKAIDSDGDGTITAQEHETAAAEMFRKMDKDHDGTLSVAEIRSGHERMMSGERE